MNNRMRSHRQRVLQIYQNYYPGRGGIEDHIRTLCHTLQGHISTTVLTSSRGAVTRCENVEGIPVIRLGSWGHYYSPFCPTMPAHLRALPADIMHVHMPCPIAELSFLLARPDTPLAVSYHNDVVQPRILVRLYEPFLRMFLQRADRILVSSEPYLHSSRFLREFTDKCELIPYGIHVEDFLPTDEVLACAARIRARCPGRIILFVGRLCYYKGLEHLIPAMQGVDATLLIVGIGPLERKFRRLAAKVKADIRFVGPVSDAELAAYYHASEVVILPSTQRSEAFGLVQLQAQACARPIITTSLPGVSSVTLHGETGLIIPPASVDAIREAIMTLLEDKFMREEMGRAGHVRVIENYQADQMAQRISRVYETIR